MICIHNDLHPQYATHHGPASLLSDAAAAAAAILLVNVRTMLALVNLFPVPVMSKTPI